MILIQKYIWNFLYLFVVLWDFIKTRINVWRLGSKIPGPIALPLIGNLFVNFDPSPEGIVRCGLALRAKYGDIFRTYFGPKIVVANCNHLDCELLLSKHDYLEKGLLYSFLKPWLGTGLLLSSGEKWHRRRKILTPAFHFKILEQFVPVFNSCGDEFIRQLGKRAGGESFDVSKQAKLLALDVICETIMGVQMNSQTDCESEYVNAVNEISKLVYEWGTKPWLFPEYTFKRSRLGRRINACLEILHSTTDQVIRLRRVELNKLEAWKTLDIDEIGRRRRVAFLDLLLLAARDGSLSDEDIREEVDTFMFEGHDTTSVGISFTLYLLSLHKNVQDKILQELETVFDPSKPLEPSLQQLSELKYLEMVIKESMRIYPPVPAVSRELTSDMTVASCPLTVPKSSEFHMSFFLLHRNQETFPDPETFDPERFCPEECARRHPFAYLPFSAGPRNCIGQRFAMLEMKSIIAKVIWNFRLLPDPTFNPILSWELTLKSKNGIYIRLENRYLSQTK